MLTVITIISVAIITAIFFTWFFIHKSKSEERRILLEKGFEPSELPEGNKFSFNFPWLKIGCVITFATIGLIIGVVLSEERILEYGGEPLLGVLLFGGVGIIISHYLDNSNGKS